MPIETTLVERLQALATELQGQMDAASSAGASPPEELSAAARMMVDLQEAAAILGMVDDLFRALLASKLPQDVYEQIVAIQERTQHADPEP